MDLEQYKQTWQNQSEESNKISKVEIYKMTHKKSSSIVKWIFIIGIAEFCLWTLFSIFNRPNYTKLKTINFPLENFLIVTEVISYLIITFFLIQFYKNYKSISVADNTKILMQKIKKTRKSVKNYVLINLSFGGVILFIITSLFIFSLNETNESENFYLMYSVIIIVIIVIILIIWLFYQLIYGILLKKLNNNYKELANLDKSN